MLWKHVAIGIVGSILKLRRYSNGCLGGLDVFGRCLGKVIIRTVVSENF